MSASHTSMAALYVGPASLQFAEKLRSWDAEVRVPTTLNAISVDRLNWRMLGVPADSGEPAEALRERLPRDGRCAELYVCALPVGERPATRGADWMGGIQCCGLCQQHFGSTKPGSARGTQNSQLQCTQWNDVRGTQKYADFLDACVAITGRAPRAGCHVDGDRKAGGHPGSPGAGSRPLKAGAG